MTDPVRGDRLRPERTWLLECRYFGERAWHLTIASQRDQKCRRCKQDIFTENNKSEHRV